MRVGFVEVVEVERWEVVVAQQPAVFAVVVEVGSMVAVSGEMRSVCADLLKEVVKWQVLVRTALG